MNRNASWPAEKGGHQQCRCRTWEIKVKKSHGRQMNRNAAWPAEKADTSSAGTEPGRQKERNYMGDRMLHGQRKRADTSSAGTDSGIQK